MCAISLLVPAFAGAQSAGAGVLLGGGSSNNVTGAVSIGADILGVQTNIQYGVLNLRLWLARTPYGSALDGATVDPSLKMTFWQPRSRDMGYRYLVGSIDISGVDYHRLKDAKGWLKSESACVPLCFQSCGPCVMKFSIPLDDLPNGVYAIDLASYNDAKKNSLKFPGGSIGINRETQRVSGYYQFTMIDPSVILATYWQGITNVPDSDELKRRIEDAYLLTRFSYAVTDSRPDLDLAKLEGQYNQAAVQAVQASNTSRMTTGSGYSFRLKIKSCKPYTLCVKDCHSRPTPRVRSWNRPAETTTVNIDVAPGDYVEYSASTGSGPDMFFAIQPENVPASGVIGVDLK